jgi:hypothetical protein
MLKGVLNHELNNSRKMMLGHTFKVYKNLTIEIPT